MLHIHQSNRLEVLADRLAAWLSDAPAAPLVAEQVIVPSAGLGRWLALALATRLGVCANVRFPLPAQFVWEVFRAVLPQVPETSRFEPAVLAWRILAQLPELAADRRGAAVARYLAQGDERMCYELAVRLAGTFDQYLVYRPDWIGAWERGGSPDDWQAMLWRALVRDGDDAHWARLQARFQAAIAGATAALPARVALFGVSTLSPAYVDVLARIGAHRDVHLYLLNPCREFWADILAPADLARRDVVDEQAGHYAVGNPLLASLGRQGRELFDLLAELEAVVDDAFVDPDPTRLLGCIQADILDLRDRGPLERTELAAGDRSLQVHACHGPMREIEVLHDQLLALFAELPGLEPGDILVMAPDIDAYAPYIDAVFGAANGARYIAHAVADRSRRGQSAVIDVFFRLLETASGRWYADRVLALLECAPVARRFALDEVAIDQIRDWIRDTGIRWGRDAGHRAGLGLPPSDAHSWRAGLDRLLLGYALPGDGATLFADILPHAQVEGSGARVLAGLSAFCAALAELGERLASRHPVTGWCTILGAAVEAFLAPVLAEEPAVAALREALADLRRDVTVATHDACVGLDVVVAALETALARPRRATGFPSGAVTFSAMVPMRSIPFRVVCFVGMNDGAVPRHQPRLGFDRLQQDHRRGDRSRREDDRYLFLEALLSARDTFYLSFVGQDLRDNSSRPPSVLVAELLDYVGRGFAMAGASAAGAVLVRHPLQPFSRRYFDGGDDRLFSYAGELASAVQVRATQDLSAPAPLLADPLAPDAQAHTLDVADLVGFWINPSRAFLEHRLALRLAPGEDVLEHDEPFTLAGLARWRCEDALINLLDAGRSIEEAERVLAARGLLPHGAIGHAQYDAAVIDMQGLAARIDAARTGERLAPQAVALDLGTLRVEGELGGLSRGGLTAWRPAGLGGRHYLDLWLRHLLLNAVELPGIEGRSRFVARDRVLVLEPLAAPVARAELERLAALYRDGLTRPLPLFAASSLAYARCVRAGKADPLRAARREWTSDFGRGEDQDPWHRYVYRGIDPLGAEFEHLACAVFGPLLDCVRPDRA
ncbi:MAG: exodeoxyribonuclease V subunit gamma [Gammaproteobacteria bacterium]|nr:exodeoxyribonuclease V subunit gamma [Gammaproteobacteria bacterium]